MTNAQALSAMKALALLSTVQNADIALPTTGGRNIRPRRVTELMAEEEELLRQLGRHLPERFDVDRKCSVASAAA